MKIRESKITTFNDKIYRQDKLIFHLGVTFIYDFKIHC